MIIVSCAPLPGSFGKSRRPQGVSWDFKPTLQSPHPGGYREGVKGGSSRTLAMVIRRLLCAEKIQQAPLTPHPTHPSPSPPRRGSKPSISTPSEPGQVEGDPEPREAASPQFQKAPLNLAKGLPSIRLQDTLRLQGNAEGRPRRPRPHFLASEGGGCP